MNNYIYLMLYYNYYFIISDNERKCLLFDKYKF